MFEAIKDFRRLKARRLMLARKDALTGSLAKYSVLPPLDRHAATA